MLKYINLSDIPDKISPVSPPHYDSFEELPNTNPLVIIDMSETIVYFNHTFRNIFGHIKNSKITNLESEPDIRYFLKSFAQSNYSGIECEIDLLNRPLNSVKSFSVLIERIFVRGMEYLVLIFKALDEKIKLELKINNLNHALDYGNIPMMIISSTGRISYATAFFDKVLNTQIEMIYNENICDVLSNHLNGHEKYLLNNAIENKNEWKAVITSDYLDRTGSYFELKLLPISSYDGSSNFILTGNDITQHVTKTQLIKKNETQLRSIINNISDLLLLVKYKDGQFFFEDANENFCKTFNINKKNAIDIGNILTKEFVSVLLSEIKMNLDERGLIEFRYSYNSREYIVKVSFVINSIEEEIIYIVSLTDITDQVAVQAQLKKAYEKENHYNKLKSAILKNMSHEIRTPLNALIGYSEIIEEGLTLKDYSVLGELTHSLKDILNRILILFSNIVEVSQIESNELEFDLYNMDVNQILKSVHNKKYNEAINKKLEFKLNLTEKDAIIRIDWIKMEKVIFALVDNAIKYTSKGSITIKSEVQYGSVIISIIDTGIGMDKKRITSFVEAFIQAEEGYTKYFEGAGLGLTLAYNYVDKLGGKFLIDSEISKGTTVQIIFPLRKLDS